MNNFKFKNPTELIFGQGMIKELPKRVPAGVPVLVTFGSGSVRYNGVYRAVKDALRAIIWWNFGVLSPTPK